MKMNAEIGTRYRLEGLLLTSDRGHILQLDDGAIWALDFEDAAATGVGQRVILEGIRSGLDRITVEWIGPATDPDA